ncbi:FtsB family cell division protein [Candidatus Pelagibacter sp. HIMB1517]|jgi:cell division protein FtsB|uniref:FtsB family cell division protein n=1 Tax=Candidatus Pelagibacter sp. HIMB1517 TaxID=3413341 RepID=UPI003F8351A7
MKKFFLFFKNYKFIIINIFLIMYFVINFFDGNRGYFSFQNKKLEYQSLVEVEKNLKIENQQLKEENEALTTKINLEFIDEMYRKKFLVGKKGEKLIIIK